MFSKPLRNENGQAMVEWIFLFPLYALWMVAVVAFGEWFLIHQQLLTVARESAMLYSSGRMEKAIVLAYAQRALKNGTPPLTIPPENIQIGRAPAKPNRYRLDEVKIVFLPPPHSLLRLVFRNSLEELCVIRHAPTYFTFVAIPSGPPVPW